MILVDTSVWIDHLREAEPLLADHLARDDVACHPLVIEELALGRLAGREELLAALGKLRQSPTLGHSELLAFVAAHQLWGVGLSPVDAHLLGSVRLSPGTSLWTRDKGLKAAARPAGVPLVSWR